jgi:hypothetical protein
MSDNYELPEDQYVNFIFSLQKFSDTLCTFYQKGNCLKGNDCKFLHENNILEKYKGQIYTMCLNSSNCRILQQHLDSKDVNITNQIFCETIDHIAELMADHVGNYLCQKLLDLVNKEQRLLMINNCKTSLVDISNNQYGTRAVQKLIDVIESDDEFEIIFDTFKDHVVEMIQDWNGNHVIRKIIQKKNTQFIYDIISDKCVEVTTSTFGCFISNHCIANGTDKQKLQLFNAVESNAIALSKDEFGNYVVQCILDLKVDFDIYLTFIKRLTGNIYNLSLDKYSSNVIEKCLKFGSSECIKRIMNELLYNPNLSVKDYACSESFLKDKVQTQLLNLINDGYGNYVMQTCLNVAKIKAYEEYILMVKLLMPSWNQFKLTPYGKTVNYHFRFVNRLK